MYGLFLKRIFDLMFAIIVFPFWIMILLVIGPMIYFQDKGTIFYNADRLGENGKVFKMYKFRSMKMNAPDLRNEDGSTFNAEKDTRLTVIGKFIRKTSLDETPQILNVIKGDMSIIGPRPDLPDAIHIYDDNDSKKLLVKPGITGYSQAYSRNSSSLKQKFTEDVYYVNNVSFVLDIKILIKTIETVVLHKNVYKNSIKGGKYDE